MLPFDQQDPDPLLLHGNCGGKSVRAGSDEYGVKVFVFHGCELLYLSPLASGITNSMVSVSG